MQSAEDTDHAIDDGGIGQVASTVLCFADLTVGRNHEFRGDLSAEFRSGGEPAFIALAHLSQAGANDSLNLFRREPTLDGLRPIARSLSGPRAFDTLPPIGQIDRQWPETRAFRRKPYRHRPYLDRVGKAPLEGHHARRVPQALHATRIEIDGLFLV